MKNKSFFSQVIFLIILGVICFGITIAAAIFFGSYSNNIFNFENFNFMNMLPVILIGGFVSCVVIGVEVLFASRSIFEKVQDYFKDIKNDGGNKDG